VLREGERKFLMMPLQMEMQPLVGPLQPIFGGVRWEVKEWSTQEYSRIQKIITACGNLTASMQIETLVQKMADALELALPDKEWLITLASFQIAHTPPLIATLAKPSQEGQKVKEQKK